MSSVGQWVASPYCYCEEAALFAVSGLRHVPAAAGAGLAPLPGLSRDETAILAAALLALAFFLFLLFFILCCCCPGLCRRLCCCCGCCGSNKKATTWKDSNSLHAADYKLPRAWLEKFKGVPEDELDARIHELEGGSKGGYGHELEGGSKGGYGADWMGANAAGAGWASGMAGKRHVEEGKSAGRIKGGNSGVEDATGDFFFRGDSLSRDGGYDSGFDTGASGMKTTVFSTSRSQGQGHSGDVTSTSLVKRDHSDVIDANTMQHLTNASGNIGGLKKIQVVKETNQRTTTKFDKSGNKEITRTTTTTVNNAGIGQRLMGMLSGITGFGAPSGMKRLTIRRRQSGANANSSSSGRQTVTGRSDIFMSNLAEEGQISSNTMQGRQLSIRGTKGRKSMATGGSSSQYMSVQSLGESGGMTMVSSGGGGGGMSLMSSGGAGSGGMMMTSSSGGELASGGGQKITTTGGTGDYLYQREVQREYNINNPDNFMKLYNAYRRYLQESAFQKF